jgi:predicted phage baseplate assembly protein
MMKNCGCSKNLSCGCCEGVEPLTPQPTANRPGLNALRYRIGTHSTFFETMEARLSNFYFETGDTGSEKYYPLADLKTRLTSDASIALLSAAATVFDVLTFYQERIANEGFLRTATERRSVLELGRLVGYVPRPGVAASVFLAYTMEDESEPVEIPVGAQAQSVPPPVKGEPNAPVEIPQTFETSDKLEARKEWNDLKPRGLRPQNITIKNAEFVRTIYFAGTETKLKANDPLLFVFEGQGVPPVLRRIETVEPLFDDKKTKVVLQLSEENLFLEFVERYATNFESFCADVQEPLKIPAAKVLSDVKKVILRDSTRPEDDEIIRDIGRVVVAIGESGNKGMQRWLDSLVNEMMSILRSTGAIDELLEDVREGDFNDFMSELEEAVQGLEEFEKTIVILRRSDGFEDLVDDVIEILPKLESFNKDRFDTLINSIGGNSSVSAFGSFVKLTRPLSLPASKQPANSFVLGRSAKQLFDVRNDTLPQMVAAFNKDIGANAYQAWANTTVTKPQPVKVYALRVTAQLFGNTAQPRFVRDGQANIIRTDEPQIVEMVDANDPDDSDIILFQVQEKPFKHEKEKIIYLDTTYDKILPDSWVIIDKRAVDTTGFKNFDFASSDAPKNLVITRAANVSPSVSRSDYDFSGKTTRIELKDSWIKFIPDEDLDDSPNAEFRLVRRTIVHAQSEALELAEEGINDDVCGGRIELGALYEGLRAGRWIIVSGERADIPNTSGVTASELVMISGIEQTFDANLPGDKVHSTLILANRLAYIYKRKTVKIYGNVVKATHGETRREVLGSGDATQAMQTFTLKQPPLTFVSAPTPSGIESTLVVRVNDIKWHETDSLAGLKPQDRKFITKISDDAQTSVIFGNGEQGARLPTGVENVKAVYRSGIGKAGNVKAETIITLMTQTLGVSKVINPLRASGGADKETRDQARRNVPVALMALDRLVSTKDYAFFARTFAGIGKASARRLSDGFRQVVHLTIAGADDIPIDVNSDLYNNLRRALAKFGNPFQPVQVAARELLALIIVAKVSIHPDYLWESVAPKIRAAMFDAFSFERRELGQTVFLSEVISVIQKVEGVVYSDVDVLDAIAEKDLSSDAAVKNKTDNWLTAGSVNPYVSAEFAQRAKPPQKGILPAQLAYLSPDVPDTLILNQIEEVKK